MLLMLGTSALSMKILNWDETTRAKAGDMSGHRGKMLTSAKVGLSFVLGSAALIFIAFAADDLSTGRYHGNDDDGFECTGSMRC